MGCKKYLILCILFLFLFLSGCSEPKTLILFDGQPAINLQITQEFSIVAGNTLIDYHNISLHNKSKDSVNVSFVYDSIEGIYCSTKYDGNDINGLHLEVGQTKQIECHYKLDEMLKSGKYQTTFLILPSQ